MLKFQAFLLEFENIGKVYIYIYCHDKMLLFHLLLFDSKVKKKKV